MKFLYTQALLIFGTHFRSSALGSRNALEHRGFNRSGRLKISGNPLHSNARNRALSHSGHDNSDVIGLLRRSRPLLGGGN
jgi:hypothetical protein